MRCGNNDLSRQIELSVHLAVSWFLTAGASFRFARQVVCSAEGCPAVLNCRFAPQPEEVTLHSSREINRRVPCVPCSRTSQLHPPPADLPPLWQDGQRAMELETAARMRTGPPSSRLTDFNFRQAVSGGRAFAWLEGEAIWLSCIKHFGYVMVWGRRVDRGCMEIEGEPIWS